MMALLTDTRSVIVFLAISALTGFFLGRITAPFSESSAPQKLKNIGPRDLSENDYPESDEESTEDEDEPVGDLASFGSNAYEENKLVLVVRTDLGMTKGKIAAQCGHATLACYKTLKAAASPVLTRWERSGQAKIAVQARSEEQILELQAQAMSLGLCARVIHDAGRTQIAAGSATVLGVGPGPKSVIDQVTGGLKLL